MTCKKYKLTISFDVFMEDKIPAEITDEILQTQVKSSIDFYSDGRQSLFIELCEHMLPNSLGCAIKKAFYNYFYRKFGGKMVKNKSGSETSLSYKMSNSKSINTIVRFNEEVTFTPVKEAQA